MTPFFTTSRARWFAAAGIALAMAACAKKQATAADGEPAADKPVLVATVDGAPISRGEYDFYLKSLTQGKAPAELTAEQKNQVLDELVSMQLIAAQGLKDGLDKLPDVTARLQVTRMRLIADAESQKYLKGKEPTDADLHAEYDTAIAAMDRTEYHARHILVATKDAAVDIIKRLKGGAKFEDIAKAQSIDGSKTQGGDLGWFSPARMVKPFADAVKGLKKGETTPEPVQTQFGWHVIQLVDTREVAPPPFDQVKEQLGNRVMQKKLQAYVEELRKTAKIDKTPL